MNRILKLSVLCTAGLAQASGFYLVDNGAKAMMQGGAFTAQADDATAMEYNPAGLAKQPGWSLLVDVDLLQHSVTYTRMDTGATEPPKSVNTVSNSPELFVLPFFAATYGFPLAGRTFTVGLGLYAPPSQGKYVYPTPNYTKNSMGEYVERANKFAPQRYALISNNIVIAYPTLSLAYDIHPRFQVGISAQLTLSRFQQVQTLYGGDVLGDNPNKQLLENPDYDVTVGIDLPGKVGFTGILGVMARPTDWLSIGASVRPPIAFNASGKLTVELPEFFKSAGATVTGDTATLQMTLPLEVKVGARVTPIANLGINLDFTYQGWNSVDQLLVTPTEVYLKAGPMAEAKPIPPVSIRKSWMPAYSVRLGASYRIFQYLSVSAGALYETGAAPTTTYSVDWTHPSRIMVSGGVTGHLGPVDVLAGALFTPTTTSTITDSQVLRPQTEPSVTPPAVGNGIYTSGAWGLIFGVRANFGAAPTAPKPIELAPTSPPPAAVGG